MKYIIRFIVSVPQMVLLLLPAFLCALIRDHNVNKIPVNLFSFEVAIAVVALFVTPFSESKEEHSPVRLTILYYGLFVFLTLVAVVAGVLNSEVTVPRIGMLDFVFDFFNPAHSAVTITILAALLVFLVGLYWKAEQYFPTRKLEG